MNKIFENIWNNTKNEYKYISKPISNLITYINGILFACIFFTLLSNTKWFYNLKDLQLVVSCAILLLSINYTITPIRIYSTSLYKLSYIISIYYIAGTLLSGLYISHYVIVTAFIILLIDVIFSYFIECFQVIPKSYNKIKNRLDKK